LHWQTDMAVLAEPIALRPRRKAAPARADHPAGTTPARLMTVGELLAVLEGVDPQSPVVIRGQYGGYDWVHLVGPRPLKLNVNTCPGFGPHEVPEDGAAADIVALAIECTSPRVDD
jgi:hypothetical protein